MAEHDTNTLAQVVAAAYGIAVAQVVPLAWGADAHATVYKLRGADHADYFLKVRSDKLNTLGAALPHFLQTQGMMQVVAPIQTQQGMLWVAHENRSLMLYPFVEGKNAFEQRPTLAQWRVFGVALRQLHAMQLPADLMHAIEHESFSPHIRTQVRGFIDPSTRLNVQSNSQHLLKDLLTQHRPKILHMLARADALANVLVAQQATLPFVLCHADAHVWNLLISQQDELWIVDWDAPVFAPKERDLMFVGSGIGYMNTPAEQAAFYAGYGAADVNATAICYYRYERILADIVAYAEQIFLDDAASEADKLTSADQLQVQFEPNGVVEIAHRETL